MLDLTSPTSPLPERRWNQLPNPSQPNQQTPQTQLSRPRQRQIPSTRPSSTSTPASNAKTTPPPFRNVSACNRCRLRKHRCDQRLPRCESCEKAGARCVGYDPLTKRELPRSYVSFLESRVTYLKQVLIDHNIDFKPATAYDEEETLRLEAGAKCGDSPEGAGFKDGIVARSSMAEQRDGSRRKRKIGSVEREEEVLPPRQMKRLCQLSLLLKEFFNDGCTRRHYGEHMHEHEHQENAETNNHPDRVQHELQQSQPWSPQSYESMEHSDNHTMSGSESPEYPTRQYHDLNTGNEISAFDGMFGSTRGPKVYGIDMQPRINLGSDLVDLEFDMPETKASFAGRNRIRNTNTARRESLSDEEQAEADAKFDIGAELLRQRTEKANNDLLDEFLVGWRDSD
ncbi:hypothetical protein PENANT_c031G09543 [Penicillium antarcticum]|uniref:Zn(2)-C6 fungal-type domain-containing protein n=1 Tax=Penicillium antarcticum TaxID=416450 RepID=A0A1V6PUZ0_9EURO|nr:uncharacterized protein N7508_005542 [Penicillium antarcticum]KAJ5306527.1 hypothetical protein N7508_005542 [Penicillium antarcticum]OQD80828.1 hypothetical protein PENANT_c031G09543 [Penicillium antarcticum]